MSATVSIESRDYCFKVIEMLQQNRALIDAIEDDVTAYFVSDTGDVFDQIAFDSIDDAKASLSENAFQRFADDPKAVSFIRPPNSLLTPHPHPSSPIYSSGRFWRGLP